MGARARRSPGDRLGVRGLPRRADRPAEPRRAPRGDASSSSAADVLGYLTRAEALGPSAARVAAAQLEDALETLGRRSGPGDIPAEARRVLAEVRAEPPGKLFGIASLLPLLSALDELPPSEVDGRALPRLAATRSAGAAATPAPVPGGGHGPGGAGRAGAPLRGHRRADARAVHALQPAGRSAAGQLRRLPRPTPPGVRLLRRHLRRGARRGGLRLPRAGPRRRRRVRRRSGFRAAGSWT